MAKKTKREKVLAELHREKQKLAVQMGASSVLPKYQLSVSETKVPLRNQNQPAQPTVGIAKADYAYVLHDLSHTLILTVLAICAQLCVYYLLEIKHISFFKF